MTRSRCFVLRYSSRKKGRCLVQLPSPQPSTEMNGTLTLGALPVPGFRSAAILTSRPRQPMRTLAFAPAVALPAVSRSLYDVLQVKETASAAEIKSAYRSLAKRFHPDASAAAASPASGEEFIEIHRAYATLSDPSARAQYDLSMPRFEFSGRTWARTRRWETDQCW
ncbi:hypothetical protein Taro_019437 [Colocasia esculenta]|uniref:J domain-containing protein n=1 Tax=Colocasia esculenta TaxID=4460 RepID=A0A843V270_COLES|nr:hypothetical protein [Colocasia esculenta]